MKFNDGTEMRVVSYDPAKVNEFADTVFADLCDGLRAEKREACADEPDDIPAHILYLPMQRSALHYIIPGTIGFDMPMQELMMVTLNFAQAEIGAPRLIGFGADAAMRIFDEKDPFENDPAGYQRGSIVASLGRDPKVRECLTGTVVHRLHKHVKLRCMSRVMPYHYDEAKQLVFDDDDGYATDSETVDNYQIGGAIEAIMRAAFAQGGN